MDSPALRPVLGAPCFGAPGLGTGDILDLDTADIVLDASAQPPPDTRAWTPVHLPDNWNLSRPGQGGDGLVSVAVHPRGSPPTNCMPCSCAR